MEVIVLRDFFLLGYDIGFDYFKLCFSGVYIGSQNGEVGKKIKKNYFFVILLVRFK